MCEIQYIVFLKGKNCVKCKKGIFDIKMYMYYLQKEFEPIIQRVINDLKQGCENSPFKLCENAGTPTVKGLCSFSIKWFIWQWFHFKGYYLS